MNLPNFNHFVRTGRVQLGKRRPGPMATMRERFATGVPLGTVWHVPVTCATWRVYRVPRCHFSVN